MEVRISAKYLETVVIYNAKLYSPIEFQINLFSYYILGPLTFYNVTDKRFYVQGVASFGAPNCDYPNVYARVSAAYDWINCIINGDTKCHEKAYNAQNHR